MGNCCGRRGTTSKYSIVPSVDSRSVDLNSRWLPQREKQLSVETYYLVDKWVNEIKAENPHIKKIPAYHIDQKAREINSQLRLNVNYGSSLGTTIDQGYDFPRFRSI